MKSFFLFLLCVVIGASFVFGLQFFRSKNATKSSTQLTKTALFSSEKPPKEALVGQIEVLTGDVSWESRIATEPGKITTARKIQQGEKIKTASGSASVSFTNTAKLVISPHAEIMFAQTLPANIVFAQNEGLVEYNRLGNVPLSVRAMHLLLDFDLGDIQVAVDKEEKTVAVEVKNGKATAVYNDLEYNSKVLNLDEGESLMFNDDTREVERQ